MVKILNGRAALNRVDMAIADLRRALGDAIEAAETGEARRAEVRDGQVKTYRALADIRLDIAASAPTKTLDELHSEARRLLVAHEAHVEKSQDALDTASDRLAELEAKRAELLKTHDETIAVFEQKVAEVEAALIEDETYMALADESETASSIVARAKQKLELAIHDRAEKGVPYDGDPLFSYLWTRQYRMPDYEAAPLTRFLDGWVARLCNYDKAYLNYGRLTELPDRVAEHVERVTEAETDALQALEQAETDALRASGADALQGEAEKVLAEIAETDREITNAEAAHQAIAQGYEDALKAQTGPAADARRLLADGLRQSSFPDLRVLAAETIDLEDDRLVDQLVKLRAEEMSLDLEAERVAEAPATHRQDLGAIEAFRRKFKAARFDSAYAGFSRAAVDRAIVDIVRGTASVEQAMRALSRAMRRDEPKTSRGFGGRRRSNALGLPDILGDVMIEVAKEAMRSGGSRRGGAPFGGGPWDSRPVRRRSPKMSFPSSRGSRRKPGGKSQRRGGFTTGGRF